MAKIALDPQKQEFLSLYTNPKSATFGNALQSALGAKYSRDYAENIMALRPDWLNNALAEDIGKRKRLVKAERVLDEVLDSLHIDENGKVDVQLLKAKLDAAKFIGKASGEYTEKSNIDITSGGLPLPLLGGQSNGSTNNDN